MQPTSFKHLEKVYNRYECDIMMERKEQRRGTVIVVPAAWAHCVITCEKRFKVAIEGCKASDVPVAAWVAVRGNKCAI